MARFVDKRLLLLSSYYKEKMARIRPEIRAVATKKKAQNALLAVLVAKGHAICVKDAAGNSRYEPTDTYIDFLTQEIEEMMDD
jgi:hypothetical protein